MHKWEPDIYIGFLPALHLQCVRVQYMQFLHISRKKNLLGKDPEEGRDAAGEKVCSRFLGEKDPIYVCVRRRGVVADQTML